ncbi:unnamed protein product [Mycena citricolor]|uniref:Uncharacterized protein n=1 Tax=Mycena citricolor TaxID=2018698 RepID=A0AAD2HUQ7_9AGAR|nr:unnamed protein product [Mycena citricolor]
MAIRRVFGSLRASPEFAEAIRSHWIFRRNQSVGHRNRTGSKFCGHFDLWLTDEITEIASQLAVAPSFNPPALLATQIATTETFGIIPIDRKTAADYGIVTLPNIRVDGVPEYHDMPVHTLMLLFTRRTNVYRHLQLRQRALYPVLPVATQAEYRKFKEEINNPTWKKNSRRSVAPHEANKAIDFERFAVFWNNLVNTQDQTICDPERRLYSKLPQQLEAHHKKVIAYKMERSTLFMGENASALQPFNNLVTAINDTILFLPAVALPNSTVDDTTKDLDDLAAISRNAATDILATDRVIVSNPNDFVSQQDPDEDVPQPDGSSIQPSQHNTKTQVSTDVDTAPQVVTLPTASSSSTHVPRDSATLSVPMQTQLTVGHGSVGFELASGRTLTEKPKKRCARCVAVMCPKRSTCPGCSNRNNCKCLPPHPEVQKGRKARLHEHVIQKRLMDRNVSDNMA